MVNKLKKVKEKKSRQLEAPNIISDPDHVPAASRDEGFFPPTSIAPIEAIEVPDMVDGGATMRQVRDSDMQILDVMFMTTFRAWGSVNTMEGMDHMIRTTKDLLKTRRELLGLGYGVDRNEVPGEAEEIEDDVIENPLKPQG